MNVKTDTGNQRIMLVASLKLRESICAGVELVWSWCGYVESETRLRSV